MMRSRSKHEADSISENRQFGGPPSFLSTYVSITTCLIVWEVIYYEYIVIGIVCYEEGHVFFVVMSDGWLCLLWSCADLDMSARQGKIGDEGVGSCSWVNKSMKKKKKG